MPTAEMPAEAARRSLHAKLSCVVQACGGANKGCPSYGFRPWADGDVGSKIVEVFRFHQAPPAQARGSPMVSSSFSCLLPRILGPVTAER